ncbi:uncharacterized protein BDW43DRAFT_284127 [Aspergillus alliaceus]|uniref:uncharacterized protein n=1 Tax=Petromyces alliaceus TaxID=209559 RepID=UPI0012A58348|nr:uncharacterized protein BDW43DRAFT_284127 [Aspergillus alliaceus]KAB8230857.1 hypothetical protein BDW43DRAFT_284127 [Aspergillus alliaceus]
MAVPVCGVCFLTPFQAPVEHAKSTSHTDIDAALDGVKVKQCVYLHSLPPRTGLLHPLGPGEHLSRRKTAYISKPGGTSTYLHAVVWVWPEVVPLGQAQNSEILPRT